MGAGDGVVSTGVVGTTPGEGISIGVSFEEGAWAVFELTGVALSALLKGLGFGLGGAIATAPMLRFRVKSAFLGSMGCRTGSSCFWDVCCAALGVDLKFDPNCRELFAVGASWD